MNRIRLLLGTLRYFRAANLAVVAGMAVATAVLTGALLVGDSVRGSLRDLTLQRLGPVDFALVAPRFFEQSLAGRLQEQAGLAARFEVVPAIAVRGGASDEGGRHRTGGVQIFAAGGDWVRVLPDEAVINGVLADSLAMASSGSAALLQVPAPGEVPRDAPLARRSADEVASRPRVRIARIASEPGLASMFSLEGGQRLPRIAWMNLADLQRQVRQPRRVNLLLATMKAGAAGQASAGELNELLKRVARLDDYGMKLSPAGDGVESALSSRSTYIQPAVDQAAERAARRVAEQSGKAAPLRRVSVQLINNVVRLSAGGAEEAKIHYAVAAGISAGGDLSLAEDEVALNEWAAGRLGAKVGDRIRLDYYQRRLDGELEEVRSDRPGVGITFRVQRILPMSGLGADRSLTPDYPGLTDKASIREAPAELGIKDELLSEADEAYWQQHRAAPKLLLNLQTARRLWGEAHGELTGIRVPTEHAAAFERELLKELDPATMGMNFRAIKAEQLRAAAGSTDFSMLFVGLSFFLIASAALLVAMLFRLSVEQRSRQFGLLQAVGFTPAALYRLALGEGLVLACAGGAIGLLCAVGYTWLMVTGLRTWWVEAVGTTALTLHVQLATLVIGLVASLTIAMLAIAWSARNLRRMQPMQLLSGAQLQARAPGRRWRGAVMVTIAAAALASVTLALGAAGAISGQVAFFGGGSLLLLASLSGAAWFLRSGWHRRAGGEAPVTWSIAALGIGTASRHANRSLLAISLIALASYLLVTVAAMRQGPPIDPGIVKSGTGGYRLIVQADIPLLADLNTARGRERLGMREPEAGIWSSARFMSLRRWAGQDASCLNLTRPDSPTILGVPLEMARQQRFEFASATEKSPNPWTLLEQAGADTHEVPVIADDETARYILKLGLGESLAMTDSSGGARRLRLVATLKGSIFQSELLMSEGNFRRLFPFQSGFGTVLVEVQAQHAEQVRQVLGEELDPFAVTVDATTDRLAAYKQVANTYLATFQTLGALGLLLGTIGLAVVLLRGIIERRSELALLAAIGFASRKRLALVLWENVWLLVAGLVAGTMCALVGVLPTVIAGGRGIHWSGLAVALVSILLSGLLVLVLAAWLGARNIAPADLRRE